MTSQDLVESRLTDARQFLAYAEEAFQQKFYHHVVQFAERATELALKALLVHLGRDVPHVHDLAALIGKLPVVRELPAETQSRLHQSSHNLAEQRNESIYGKADGTPPDKIFDKPQAEEALEQGRFVVSTVESLVKTEEQ